jgi:hypothetical protein
MALLPARHPFVGDPERCFGDRDALNTICGHIGTLRSNTEIG